MKPKIRRAITDLYAVGNEPSAIADMLALDLADVQAALRKVTPAAVAAARKKAPGQPCPRPSSRTPLDGGSYATVHGAGCVTIVLGTTRQRVGR